jgi:hypothetical protein
MKSLLPGKLRRETVSDILASVLKTEPDLNVLPATSTKDFGAAPCDVWQRPEGSWHAAADVAVESIIANPVASVNCSLPIRQRKRHGNALCRHLRACSSAASFQVLLSGT